MSKAYSKLVTLATGLAFVAASYCTASSENFYEGKTIRFIVGFSPRGAYDTYTRTVAYHIRKYIPGNPSAIVQNVTGGGSLISANYLYKRVKSDGLTVGVWNSDLVLQQALGGRDIRFEADRFGWVGAPSRELPTCAIMGFTGLKTLQDVLNSKRPIRIGATVTGSSTTTIPKILNKALGTNLEIIPGYKGSPEIRVAMQRRQIGGACSSWESMKRIAGSMLQAAGDDRLIPFVTQGRSKDRQIKDLPQMSEVVKGRDNAGAIRAWSATNEFYRPFSIPPGSSKEQLYSLREAFRKTLKDPAFLADARKAKLTIHYVSGERINKFVADILAISAGAKEKLQFLVREKRQR